MSELTYEKAGVDTQAGQTFVHEILKLKKIREANTETFFSKKVISSNMNFAALMDLSFVKEYQRPLLLTATDGVGTKLLLAQLFDYHESVGIDLVAMCANDILCSGGQTIQFLDYIACGKLVPSRLKHIIESILRGCELAGCPLVGGETAEHPGTMKEKEYDLAGFAVGVVEANMLIDGKNIKEGDSIIGIPSSGPHSNGFSLIRKIFLRDSLYLPETSKEQEFIFRDILSKPTIIYEPILREVLQNEPSSIKGLVHITGGGFFENIPRVLPENLIAQIEMQAWLLPEVFQKIQTEGPVSTEQMFSTFNMGMGMVVFASPEKVGYILSSINKNLQRVYPEIKARGVVIGDVVDKSKVKVSEEKVILKNKI